MSNGEEKNGVSNREEKKGVREEARCGNVRKEDWKLDEEVRVKEDEKNVLNGNTLRAMQSTY